MGTSTAPAADTAAPARPGVLQVVLSIVVVLLGAAMTTVGAFSHGSPLVAPGATLILVGAAWLGNVLARRDVRLLPSATPPSDESA